ncbi:MAG: DUF1549 and DUF1553 domain-containing protein [Bryobacteraceae bacterium]
MLRLALLTCFLAIAAPIGAAEWSQIRIVPGNIVLPKTGDSQRFLVLAKIADGQEEDVTSQCKFTLSTPGIVAVETETGIVTGEHPGRAEIRVKLASLTSSTQVTVSEGTSEARVRFSPDVISVFTTKGCNSSGCHGSPAGQNGFKLSLFGYDVAADHEMVLRKHNGRRVDLADPEKSLILRKPLFDIPHGGGRLMTKESEEYRTLLQWLKEGAKLESNGPRMTRLEMYPAEQVLTGNGSKMRFVVMGRLSDGTTRDMTHEVRYSSSADRVAVIAPDGVATATGSGLTTVLARGMGSVAASQIGVIQQKADAHFPSLPPNNFIDELVYAKQKKLNVAPTGLSTDSEFIRRVYLDTIGLAPTGEEVRAFMANQRQDKRVLLIDSLLKRPEYASFWTVKFEDWFRNNQLNSQGRSMGKFKEWVSARLAADLPYDQMVRDLITSEGDTFQEPATNFWHPATDFMLKKFDVKKATPTVSRLFLGIRMECAECHNHPLENFTQDDFYGLSAFFARLQVKHGPAEYRRTWYLADEGEVEHPVTKKPVPAKFLGGETPQFAPDEDRRVALANWVTSPKNPYFARATVNRIWHEYFQAGLVEPFDDFRSTNPATNKELLDRLAAFFVDSGFHLQALHRLILNSRTYQLSSRSAGPSANPELERLLFARYEVRKLPAEALLDSISQVTGVAHPFSNYPAGTRAMDLYVPDAPDYFLVAFGFPRRDIICERSRTPTLSQALHMINGDTVRKKVDAPDNALGGWIKDGWSDDRIVSEIYLDSYARPASSSELTSVKEFVESEMAAGRSRRAALGSFLWTVLNSKEFQVNH